MTAIDYQNDICIWFIEGQEVGHREHHFDWEEGDTIVTDGKKTEIYAIVKNTPNNVELMEELFHQCEGLFRGAKCQKKFFAKALNEQLANPSQPNRWFKGIQLDGRERRAILKDKFREVDESTFDRVFDTIDEYLEEVEV